ncbi:MAG: single-stranded DNA-binding protein [Calditrichia bacterium]
MAKGTVNKVILIGRLGRDPEVNMTASNQKVARVSIATNEVFGSGDNRQEVTDWHNLVFWGKRAEFVENYLKKGMRIFVEGKLRTRQWQDKEGNKRYTTEVIVDNTQILDGYSGGDNQGNAFGMNQTSVPEPENMGDLPEVTQDDDDIPF